jgi:Nuclease-related domain
MLQQAARQPGQWVRAQARMRERQIWMVAGLVLALALLVVAAALDKRSAFLTLVGLAFLLFLRRIVFRLIDDGANWRKGAASEEAVGRALDELLADGYTVSHDLEQEFEGNVDHLVTGPTGVFLIETKHRGYKPADLSKAKRQAKKLNDEVGEWVTPVICLDRRRTREPYRDRGVWVVSRERLVDWIRAHPER